jgi:multidrug efflux pump subunit AcrA (membrane-fusion protein)
MKKAILIVLLLLTLVAGGFYLWKGRIPGVAAQTPVQEQTVAGVKRGPIRQSVLCTGRVVSNLDVDIKCKASGQVIKLPFDISDYAKKGDLIVEIDPVDQLRAVQTAEADLAISEAKLAQAKANLTVAEQSLKAERLRTQAALESAQARAADTSAKAKREKDLLERKQSSIEEAETAQTAATQAAQDLEIAQSQIEAAKALEFQLEVKRQDIKLGEAQVQADKIALALANQRLTETKVAAPIDGVVSARSVQIGQIIASGISNVGGGTTVLTLSDLSQIFILASVDESDIGSVALDQTVDITADAFPRKLFNGKVDRIAAKGVNVSNVVTFEVRVEVLSENKTLLKPEMTGNVEIIVSDKPDTLLLPVAAISRTRDKTYVSLKKPDGTVQEQVPVEIGISNGNEIEIVSGLQENDQVLVRKADSDSRWRAATDQRRTGPPPMMFRPPTGGRR